ncbi:MAG: twin-arginine translocation signal domain-containing protein [Verrucomicrobiota bacterium]
MNKTDKSRSSTRRSFLKAAALAVAAPGTLDCNTNAASLEGSFIRVRRNPGSSGWKYYRVRTAAANFPALPNEKEIVSSIYGGNLSVVRNATGTFRTENIDGRWWLIDPNGHPFLSSGINSVSPQAGKQLGKTVAGLGDAAWSAETVKMLKSKGINTAGYWSKSGRSKEPVPHAGMAYVFYDFGKRGDARAFDGQHPKGLMQIFSARVGAKHRNFPVFHPAFADFCEQRCKTVESAKDDPWMLGYFTDNELPVPDILQCLEYSIHDPVYGGAAQEARRWREARNGAPSDLKALHAAWTGHVFDWYYRITTSAIRKYDSKHLQLGSRVFSVERNYKEVFSAAGRYLDVISINPYGVASLSVGELQQWSEWAGGKPLLIGEFYVRGEDAKTGSQRGAGLTVATQEERGLYYQNYVIALLRSRVCVGWHWHRYSDHEDESGALKLAINKGILGADLSPYHELLEKMAEMNLRVHQVAARM